VAGESLKESIEEVKKLNELGIHATLGNLGEDTDSEEEANQSTDVYLEIADHIHNSGINSTISLKPTQLGLAFDENLCAQNIKKIVERAALHDNFVRIDMESSQYVDSTLNIYRNLRNEGFDNLGVVIQSYLYRSASDLEALKPKGLNVRICKGAYSEDSDVAFPNKADVDQNFLELLGYLWSGDESKNIHAYTAIATHDDQIVEQAKVLIDRCGMNKDQFEFQMLFGVRRDLQQSLAKQGFRVRVYVSYGTEWYPFFMRRLAERPANLLFLVKNIFRK
jgi:proline dehydrogenase